MTPLEEYYNKFNEDKRLNSRHGQVEFRTSMEYIRRYLETLEKPAESICILDIGAGTGRYSIPLAQEGYQVTAVELVKHNISRLKQKCSLVTAYQGNALCLKKCRESSFDLALLFGPMYHLTSEEEKLQALEEAKRVIRPGGLLFVAYIMNEFSILTYGFKERHVLEARRNGMLDDAFHCRSGRDSLYSMVRLEDIDRMNRRTGLRRIQIIAADGPANYIRPYLNALTEEEFEQFMEYHLSTCERGDLIGASGHTVDILRVEKPGV